MKTSRNTYKLIKIQDHIRAPSKHFHNLKLKSTGSLHFNLQIHPPLQRHLKRGRPHDIIS